MALITRSATAGIDTATAQNAPQISGLFAGEALDVCAPCYIKSSDGKVYMCNATSDNEAAEFAGFTPRAVAADQPVTLYGLGVRMKYGSALTPGNILYMGATAGRLDSAQTTGDRQGLVLVLNATDVMVIRQHPNMASGTIGTDDIADDAVTLAKMAALAQGSLIVGGAANAPTALDANDDGKILVGDGTDLKSVAVSGDATLANTGALTIANDAVTLAKMANLAQGSIIVGGAANEPTALDANDDGKILVGDGTDLKSVAVSGDATLANTGALTIAALAVTKAKAKVFFSTEQTGDGNPQNVAHGLGAIPAGVLVVPSSMPDSAWALAQGAHDDTNVVVTCTNTGKYYVMAWA